ncbi:MAG TPA: SDR family oxidoreductase [Micromonosporaceae bacterium]|jgi:NAD(P)-dependent dehydrogenase (short-subunit alcohol dehydrogenase family)|nr:SDR family oxidoreductase [Micromonosporaceae bacterium]
MEFSGRTAVVTGGAGGIGRAVAAGFVSAGAAVAVVDVAGDAVRSAVASLAGSGASVKGYQVDVTDPAAVSVLMAAVAADLGGPHALVTLAGGSLGTPRDLSAIGPADLGLVLDVNVKGTFYCCQAAAPLIAAAGGGAIVTCSSIGARQPSPVTGAPYAAAKAAIGGLTRRLARELGPQGIRVNAVAPGLFLTERLRQRFDGMPEAERREVLDAIPLGRMPELREIVDPVLFLAGDEASFITGVTLDVNGGRYLPA